MSISNNHSRIDNLKSKLDDITINKHTIVYTKNICTSERIEKTKNIINKSSFVIDEKFSIDETVAFIYWQTSSLCLL